MEASFFTLELIMMELNQASYAPMLDWLLSHIACKFTELRKKTNCYCEWKKKDDLKFLKSCEVPLFMWFLESSYVAVSLTFFFWGLFCDIKQALLWVELRQLTKTLLKLSGSCVQEAQKSKWICSTIVSLQH